ALLFGRFFRSLQSPKNRSATVFAKVYKSIGHRQPKRINIWRGICEPALIYKVKGGCFYTPRCLFCATLFRHLCECTQTRPKTKSHACTAVRDSIAAETKLDLTPWHRKWTPPEFSLDPTYIIMHIHYQYVLKVLRGNFYKKRPIDNQS
ncbi:unnamed protein product, partial [Ixodes pacificus]